MPVRRAQSKGNAFVSLFWHEESEIFLLHACIICLKQEDEISIYFDGRFKTRRDELMKNLGYGFVGDEKKKKKNGVMNDFNM